MRVVDVVLDTRNTHKNALLLEAFVAEQDITAEDYPATDIDPIFLRPQPVKFARESELQFLVFVQVTHSLSEHIPRSTRAVAVVANI